MVRGSASAADSLGGPCLPSPGRAWRNANASARFTCKVAWSQGTFEWQQKYQPERTSLTLTSLQGSSDSNPILSLPI